VVEGRQVEQVFTSGTEVQEAYSKHFEQCKMLKGTERKYFPDVVSEANLLPRREKILSQKMSASSIEFFPEFAPLTKKICVWSVASCTGNVFLNENKTV
jgi:hypothetical protein